MQAALSDGLCDECFQACFDDRADAFSQEICLARRRIDAQDLVPIAGEAGGRNHSHIAESENSYFHFVKIPASILLATGSL
jgi:hypothetical protein